MGPDQALIQARGALFQLVLARYRQLHYSASPPSDFFVGERYFLDSQTVDCEIRVMFAYPAVVDKQEFWFDEAKITINQSPPMLQVVITRPVSSALWDDLKFLGVGQQFIVAYVGSALAAVNRKLLEGRYAAGHLLSRTLFIFEALEILIVCKERQIRLGWPVTLPPFPKSKALAPGRDELYLRDFIDAMHSYFRADYDDCIRRVITATENLFSHLGWQRTAKPAFWLRVFSFPFNRRTDGSFRQILRANVEASSLPGDVVSSNLLAVYSVRNRIVHKGFRMSTSSALFCDKAVSTLRYLIQRYAGDRAVSDYAYSLGIQFGILKDQVAAEQFNLKVLERFYRTPTKSGPPIDSMEAMDRAIFSSLRFTRRDMQSIG